jgi:hypothetical protein
MADRDRPRNVTQRRLVDREDTPSAEPAPVEVPPEAPPPARPEPIPRTPSNAELRARQLKWVRERERLESKRSREPTSEGSERS